MTTEPGVRMARFAAGARRVVVRAVAIGALAVAGWLLAVLFGMLTAAPAAADATAAKGAAATGADATVATGAAAREAAASGIAATEAAVTGADATTATRAATTGTAHRAFTGSGGLSASDNAEAMAGLTVDGLNSQRDPGLPPSSNAGEILDTDGLVPNGGGSGPFGPVTGDAARSMVDPRLQAGRAPLARLLPPVVRTAADDPSFSPD
ncbi:hypothetical protein [Nonomuraea candida]|uniref:hypothetical protein n=1 Tax=Nonomuraea candida TaxID=359159 RepID=UPI001FE031BA|nr:hypothetical protein [Nonomuraea candida]